MQFEKIGQYKINLNQMYYLTYAGGKRELPAKDMKEYNKIINLPFILQREELKKIPLDKNPNVVPISGRALLGFIKELNFIPFFDKFFEQSNMLKLSDLATFEFIKQKNMENISRGEM